MDCLSEQGGTIARSSILLVGKSVVYHASNHSIHSCGYRFGKKFGD